LKTGNKVSIALISATVLWASAIFISAKYDYLNKKIDFNRSCYRYCLARGWPSLTVSFSDKYCYCKNKMKTIEATQAWYDANLKERK